MAKVVTTYGNFTKGQADHDMMGRFDLPIYTTSCDVFENFISNFKGNAIYSAGFISQIAFQDCEFVEFKFGNTQNYLCLFYLNKIRFLAFDTNGLFGYVLSGGVPLEVSTPYTLAQCHTLDYTQNKDVMVVTCSALEPRKLIRTAANAFTFNTFSRLSDPFPNAYAGTKTITGITQANPAVLTIVGHGYSVSDRFLIAGVVGMTQINGYTAAVQSVIDADHVSVDLNTTSFTAYGSAGTAAKVTGGDYPACSLFYKGRLYYANTPLNITKMWFSTAGTYDDFTVPSVFTDSSAFSFVIADLAQQIEWLFPGDNSLIVGSTDGIVAVNGGGVNTAITASTVQANITSAEPTNGVYPVKKDGLIFYVGRTGRNIYYFKYDILTEAFLSLDANLVAYDITKTGLTKLRLKRDRNDLIFSLRGDGQVTSLVFKEIEKINGWHIRNTVGTFQDIAVMGDNNGDPQFFVLTNRNGTFYIEQQANYIEFSKRSDFWTPAGPDEAQDVNKDMDDEAYNRYVCDQLLSCNYLDNSLRLQDYHTTTITYDPIGGTITDPSGPFVIGDIGKHIVYKTATGYESGRFLIGGFTSANVVTVTVLQTPKQIDDTPLYVWSSWYRSFITVSGLAQYNGQTVGVVTDGGFLDTFAVSGGTITLDTQSIVIVVGYQYTGIIKSFCLGFQFQQVNTQTTLKNIVRAGLRLVASAGVKFGASLYELQDVQERSQNDLNYLPPLPIDGTKYVDYTDDSEEDKFFYIVQDQPLPCQVANFALEANYAVSS